MPQAWRLVHKNYMTRAFSGEGARIAGGRWNPEGFPVVYTAGSLSLALLEIIVHLEFKEALKQYKAIPVSIPEASFQRVDASKLSNDWNRAVPHPSTLHIGSRWVREQASAVLEVPSAIVPIESNFLLNPAHPEFGEIEVGSPIDLPIDSRVFNKLK